MKRRPHWFTRHTNGFAFAATTLAAACNALEGNLFEVIVFGAFSAWLWGECYDWES